MRLMPWRVIVVALIDIVVVFARGDTPRRGHGCGFGCSHSRSSRLCCGCR